MIIYALGALSIVFFNVVLWYFILAGKRQDKIVAPYLFWSATIALWSIGYAVTLSGLFPKDLTLLWNRACHVFACFIPVFFLQLVIAITGHKTVACRRIVISSYFIATTLILCNFTPLFVADLWEMGEFKYQPLGGPIYWVFTAFFSLIVMYGLYILYAVQKKSSGNQREQIRVFLLGSSIGYAGGFTLFLPAFHLNISPVGVFFISSYVLFTGYAIYKYGFMNLEIIIKRAAVFAGLFAFVYGVFTTITVFGQEFFRSTLGLNQWVAMIPTVTIITFSLRPLEIFLTNATDKFLFQKKYNPLQMIHDFSQAVLTELDLDKISKQTVEILSEALRIESCTLLLPNKEGSRFIFKESRGVHDQDVFIEEKSSLLSKNKNSRVVFEKNETMTQLKAVACAGILSRKNLIGVLALGEKKSGEDYTGEDIAVINILTDALGVAITNAFAYEELRHKANLVTLGTLAAGIKHDISKPIDRMSAEASEFLLQLKKGNLKNQDQYLNDAKNLIENCCETFRQVIAISDTYAARPKEKENLVMLDLSDQVTAALTPLQNKLAHSGISIIEEIPQDLPRVFYDKDYMRQILDNLFANAIDAIEAARRPVGDRKIVVRAKEVKNRTLNVRLEIIDNGTGIPDKIKDKIFRSWFTTKGDRGTGLGLSLVSELVLRGGGTIEVESEEGKGSTFILGLKGVKRT